MDRVPGLRRLPAGAPVTSEVVVDFTRLSRAIRQRKTSCAHSWIPGRAVGGSAGHPRARVERCASCGDQFPCRKFRCHHLDCIERGIELGQRGFPRDFPLTVSRLSPHHSHDVDDCAGCAVAPDHHFELNVDPSVPPESWTLPKGWKLQ